MALVNCPECNKQVSDKANACNGCGYPLVKSNIQKCPECGKAISDTATNCLECGFTLSSTRLEYGTVLKANNNVQSDKDGDVVKYYTGYALCILLVLCVSAVGFSFAYYQRACYLSIYHKQ